MTTQTKKPNIREIFKLAHLMTKNDIQKGDNYSVVFACNLKAAWAKEKRYLDVINGKKPESKPISEKTQQANAESQAAADFLGLPTLSGSPKQIAWATTIRQNFLKSVDVENLNTAFKKVANKASFWIDNRQTNREELAKLAFMKNAGVKFTTSYSYRTVNNRLTWA